MIKLTDQQADCIDHRLSAADALVEVFEDRYAPEDVYDACEDLAMMVADNQIDFAALTPISRNVLIDCIEGSVWVASVEYETDGSRWRGACRVIENLADKFRDAGLEIGVVPTQ
jgi:hypothetical protein